MSIIGTRPPLISETNLYELHHRANRIEQMLRSQSERNNLILEHERFDITKNANKLDRFYRRRIEDLK